MRFLSAWALMGLVLPLPSQTLITTNKDASTASILDLKDGRTLATLPTGAGPHELAVSHDGKLAVVTDYGAAGPGGTTLTVIDLATRKVARTIDLSPEVRPHGAAFLPDHRTLAVTLERAGKIVLVDVITGTVKGQRLTGQRTGHMVSVTRDGKTAYVANITSGTLSILDLVGNAEPITVPVGTQTEAIALSPDEKTVWMGSNNTGKVFLIDVAQRKVVDSIQTPWFPYRIGFTSDTRTAIITNPEQDEARIIDIATRKIRTIVSLHAPDGSVGQPQGIWVVGDKAYITLGKAASVAEVQISTGKVLRHLTTDTGPDGIVVTQ